MKTVALDRRRLEAMALRDPDPMTRFAAVGMLRRTESRPVIERVALNDPVYWIRDSAIAKLCRSRSCDVLKVIALTDPDEHIKIQAAGILDPIKDLVVLERLKSMGKPFRRRVVELFRRLKRGKMLPPIVRPLYAPVKPVANHIYLVPPSNRR